MDQPGQTVQSIQSHDNTSNFEQPSVGQQASNALSSAGSSVAETTSGWYDSFKKAFGMGSSTTNLSGNTGGGRRKKKRTKRAKKSAKKTKRSKK